MGPSSLLDVRFEILMQILFGIAFFIDGFIFLQNNPKGLIQLSFLRTGII